MTRTLNRALSYVRRADGTFAQFDVLDAGTGGSLGTYTAAINPRGVVAGYARTTGLSPRAFIRGADGWLREFEVPGASGAGAAAVAINRRGAIAGSYVDAKGHIEGFARAANGTSKPSRCPMPGSPGRWTSTMTGW